jgi:hypothetical protein
LVSLILTRDSFVYRAIKINKRKEVIKNVSIASMCNLFASILFGLYAYWYVNHFGIKGIALDIVNAKGTL